MKKILTIAFLLTVTTLLAQTPQTFNYQGILRDSLGKAIPSKNVTIKASILNGSASGSVVYSETHSVTTGTQGLFNLAIGGGSVVSGTFSQIPWDTGGGKYLRIDFDPNAGSNFSFMGTTQLLSVPYALVSGSSQKSGDLPVGTVNMFAGSQPPTGWLVCDGSAISRSQYSTLFALIGTTYGIGNGSTTFNLPDARGRFPLAAGQGSNLTSRNLADKGGEEQHTMTINELVSHNHTYGQQVGNAGGGGGGANVNGNSNSGWTTDNKGGSQPFPIMPPFVTFNFVIKY